MDLPKFHPNERVDLGDIEFLSSGQLGEFQRGFTNLIVGEATKRIIDGFTFTITSPTVLQIALGKAVLADNRNAVIRYGQLVGGGFPVEGVALQNVSFSGLPVLTHGVYARFVYGDAAVSNRAFWDTLTDVEEIQAVNTRKIAGWQVTVSKNDPGSEWSKLCDVAWDGANLNTSVITDKRTFLFEGPADSTPQTFRPTWGGGSDRSAARATNGVKTLERFASAVLKKIEEIQSDTPATRWWDAPVEPLSKKVSRFGDANMAGDYTPEADGSRSFGSSTRRWLKLWANDVDASGNLDVGGSITAADDVVADNFYGTTGVYPNEYGNGEGAAPKLRAVDVNTIDLALNETVGKTFRVRFGGATNAMSIASVGVSGTYLMTARSWLSAGGTGTGALGNYSLTWLDVWSETIKSYRNDSVTAPALATAGVLAHNYNSGAGQLAQIGWSVSGGGSPTANGDGWIVSARRNADNDVDMLWSRHDGGVHVAYRMSLDDAGVLSPGATGQDLGTTGLRWDVFAGTLNANGIATFDADVDFNAQILSNITPNTTGLDLGTTSLRWDVFAGTGNFNNTLTTDDIVPSASGKNIGSGDTGAGKDAVVYGTNFRASTGVTVGAGGASPVLLASAGSGFLNVGGKGWFIGGSLGYEGAVRADNDYVGADDGADTTISPGGVTTDVGTMLTFASADARVAGTVSPTLDRPMHIATTFSVHGQCRAIKVQLTNNGATQTRGFIRVWF